MRTHRSIRPIRSIRSTGNSRFTFTSIFAAGTVVALATGAVLTAGTSPAVAAGSLRAHPVNLTQPAFRSVVVGAAVVSLATLDLPGPASAPPVPTPSWMPKMASQAEARTKTEARTAGRISEDCMVGHSSA